MIMLQLINIHKRFKVGITELHVLKGVSFIVEHGDLMSVIGPSGCGKSTFMNIVGLLDEPTSGEYFFDDMKIAYDDDRTLSSIRNKKIGFIFQQYNLLPRLDALENVGLPLVYRGIPYEEIKERSMEALKKVNMDDRAHHKPGELSGGQQQRVAIARALVGDPAIILADEPTGALDSHVGQEILDYFIQLNEEKGIAFLIITHDRKIAAQCRKTAEMKDGEIIS